MRLLRASGYPAMPWKNGGGETREIALSPPGAALSAFDWRVSIARVDGDGPFSAFDGIDRTLTVLSGAMTLHGAGGDATALDAATEPFSFDGGTPITAIVESGPVTDLNVMTRRTRHSHRVRREIIHRASALTAMAPVTLIVPLGDALSARGAALSRHDCLMLVQGETVDLATGPADETILLIEIMDAG